MITAIGITVLSVVAYYRFKWWYGSYRIRSLISPPPPPYRETQMLPPPMRDL